MANWYVAPDSTTTPGVTLLAIGATGYGTDFAHAAKWSDFANGAGSIWTSKVANSDTIIFLAGQYRLSAAVGGWVSLNTAFTNLTLSGQTVAGRLGFAEFIGSRAWPWPADGDHGGAAVGETMFRVTGNLATMTLTGLAFKHLSFPVTPASNGTSPALGTLTVVDCVTLNTAGCFGYTSSSTDGRINVNRTRVKMHGYSRGGSKVWGSINDVDVVGDSEFQATAANSSNATQTSSANSGDSLPAVATTQWPCTAARSIYRNHAAGGSAGGSNYPQGDGFVCEENVGTYTGKDVLTYGNGDRGIDLKCAGTAIRHHSWGDGTAGIAHHMDNLPLTVVQSNFRTGSRPATVTLASTSLQSSGVINIFQSALIANPTAAQVANNPFAIANGTVDVSKFQHSLYGACHIGQTKITDCWGYFNGTNGATEQQGFTGTADTARVAAIFGLTPGSTYNFAVRALAQDGSASAWSSNVAFTMDAASSGDTTGPAAPTGLTVVTTTSSTATMSWVPTPQDAGVEIQGHIFRVTAPGDATPIVVMPGKTTTPVTFSGLKPATAYTFAVAAFDGNGNLGTFSSNVTATTTAGSTSTATPSTPGSVAVATGWINHSTLAGLQWGLPATGTVAFYEVKDAGSGVVVARCYPIPNTANVPTYSRINTVLASV